MKQSRYFQNWKVLGMEDRQHVHSPAFVVCLEVQVRTYLLFVVVSVRDDNEVFLLRPFYQSHTFYMWATWNSAEAHSVVLKRWHTVCLKSRARTACTVSSTDYVRDEVVKTVLMHRRTQHCVGSDTPAPFVI